MTLHKPLHMQPASGDPDTTYTGAEERALIEALFPFDGVVEKAGLLTLLQVTQRGAGANFSVDVAAGKGIVIGDDVAGQGNYLCWNDATFNLATPTAPGSGTRLHRVGLQVRDKLNNGTWTQYDFTPLVVQDTGSGFPAEPASFLTLAQVSIAAGQANVSNANITDMRVPVAASGAAVRRWKTGSGTTRTSTTASADPDLSIMLAGSATYEVEAFFDWTATGSEKLSYGWIRPSGSTGNWGHVANIGGAPGINNYGYGWSFVETAATQATAPSSAVTLRGTIFTPSGVPQPLAVNWGTSGGTSVQLNAGSYLKATRLA